MSAIAREASDGGQTRIRPELRLASQVKAVRFPFMFTAGSLQQRFGMPVQKCTVYLLGSETLVGGYYVGLTSDMAARLETHNSGGSAHTASGRPWRVVVAIEFDDEYKAIRFERYLKSGSGRAFANRHFR
jgi:putative endonuclease